jgi:hypothetical protein
VKAKEKSIMRIFKKYTVFVTLLIVIVLISMLFLISSALISDYNNSIIINILGRQRMLTQSMAKNANQIYILRSSLVKSDGNVDIRNQLELSIGEINKSREEYIKQINAIENGYVLWDKGTVDFKDSLDRLSPTLSENEKIWSGFESSLDILISEDGDSNGREKALEFINQNNNMLMNYSIEITPIKIV